MTTLSFTFVSVCAGGCHATLGVSLNGGAVQNVTYNVDDIRAPLSALSAEDRADLALNILKVHFAGKTRAQVGTEFQAGPVVATI